MKAKLTNTYVEKLKPQERRYDVWDTVFKGLHVRVSPSGDKVWYLYYRFEGKRRKFSLGRGLTVAQARDAATAHAGDIAKGIDIQEKREEQRRQANIHSLRSFIEGPYLDWRKVNRKQADKTLSIFEKHFFPIFVDTQLNDITAWKLEKWKTSQLKAGIKPTTVNRYIAELKSALSKAIEWGEITEHPLKLVNDLPILQISKNPRNNLGLV